MSTQMIIRLDPDLKGKASNFAKAEGKNVSEIVRELLVSYVKSRDIGSYIETVWNRVGVKIKEKGFSSTDVDAMVKKVRAGQ